MDPVINNIDIVSIISIIIMIGSLIIAYVKKWMVTYALIIANVIVFVLTLLFTVEIDGNFYNVVILDLGFRPIYLTPEYSPQLYTLFTSMFVHGGFAHIFGNMFIFLFLGMAFEQRIGAKKFLIIYIISGICGTLTHSLMNIGSDTLLIGASGAIFGIMGAFAFSYLYPDFP
jgi:membrane associated rhomboid family serine protease